jgi:hypothetical protein
MLRLNGAGDVRSKKNSGSRGGAENAEVARLPQAIFLYNRPMIKE